MQSRTISSRGAVVAMAALSVVELAWANRAGDNGFAVPAAVLAALTVIIAIGLARRESFEARLAAVFTASVYLLIGVLAATIGLPGQEPHRSDPLVVATVVISASVILLLAWDRRSRRHYAR